MTHSYVIWIPFEFPPQNDAILDAPVEVDVCGYPGKFRQYPRFKGLEIAGLPSEDAARKLFRRITAALLYAVIGRGPHMRFDVDPVPVTYKEDDPTVYWVKASSISPMELRPFNASRAVIYRGDKQITTRGVYMELSVSSGIEGFVEAFRSGLALPTLQDGIAEQRTGLALELYCLSGFEASDRARFLTLCTVLEVLTPSTSVRGEIARQVEAWIAEARVSATHHREQAATEGDDAEVDALQQSEAWETLARRLGNLKTESITSALKSRTEQLLRADGHTDAASCAARVVQLYRKRSGVTHWGRPVSADEVFELDEIVRMALIAAMRIPRSSDTSAGTPLPEVD